jgi:hypothetical protein
VTASQIPERRKRAAAKTTVRAVRAGLKILDNLLQTSKGFPYKLFHFIIEPQLEVT